MLILANILGFLIISGLLIGLITLATFLLCVLLAMGLLSWESASFPRESNAQAIDRLLRQVSESIKLLDRVS